MKLVICTNKTDNITSHTTFRDKLYLKVVTKVVTYKNYHIHNYPIS